MDEKSQAQLKEVMVKLPKAVQRAIASADMEKQLRSLAQIHKLHLDQWVKLENEVMLTLLAIHPFENLQQNIKNILKVSEETAADLTVGINHIVFEPIREQLERELEHPEAKAEKVSGVEQARTSALESEQRTDSTSSPQAVNSEQKTAAPEVPINSASLPPPPSQTPTLPEAKIAIPVLPATPPPAPPIERAVRAPTTSAYKPGEVSAARKNVHDDPYREPPA